jgi:peroxiredoxin
MSLLIGQTLPYTELPSTQGGTVNPAKLRGLAIFFCYPYTGRPDVPNPPNWDRIPGAHGSTPQAQAYAQLHPQLLAHGAQVHGLSYQESLWQTEFAKRCDLPFPLLSDAARTFSNALLLPNFATGAECYLERLTLIARDARITAVRNKIADPSADAREVLRSIESRLA